MRYYIVFFILSSLCADAQIKSSIGQFLGNRKTYISHVKNDNINFLEHFDSKGNQTYLGVRGSLEILNKIRLDAEMSAYEDELPKNFGIKLIYFLHPSIGGILALENHNLNYTYPYNIKYFEDLPGFYPSNLTTNSLKGNNINMTYLNLGGVYKFNNQWLEIEAELKAGILNPNVIKPKRQVFTKRDSYERMGVDIDIQRVFPVSIHNQISLTYYPFKKIRLGINGRFQISGSKFSLPYTRTIYHWTEENFTKQKIEMQKSKFWISTNDFGITYRFN